MEVKIGVQYAAARDRRWRARRPPTRSRRRSADALKARRGVLTLVDEKGRRVVVPADKIAYVEIAEADQPPGRLRRG